MQKITCERIKYSHEWIITVITTKRSWFGLGMEYTTIKRYRGSSTVWRDADTGQRQGVFTESRLADICAKARWDEEAKEREKREKRSW